MLNDNLYKVITLVCTLVVSPWDSERKAGHHPQGMLWEWNLLKTVTIFDEFAFAENLLRRLTSDRCLELFDMECGSGRIRIEASMARLHTVAPATLLQHISQHWSKVDVGLILSGCVEGQEILHWPSLSHRLLWSLQLDGAEP